MFKKIHGFNLLASLPKKSIFLKKIVDKSCNERKILDRDCLETFDKISSVKFGDFSFGFLFELKYLFASKKKYK